MACDASALPVSELAAEADVVLSLLSLARRLDAAARFPALERARPGLTQPHAAAALAAAMDDEPAAAQALAAAVGGRLLLGLAGASVSADPLSTAVDAVSALCAHATARLAAAEAAFAPARRGGVGGVTAGDAAAAVRAAEAADPANFPTLLVEAVLARVGDAGRAAFLAGLAAAGLPPGAAAACAATADALLSEPELLLVPTSPDGAGQFEGPLGALRGSGGGAAGAA